MKCLLVIAHPLRESLCNHMAEHARRELEAAGHEVVVADLYRDGFDARLSSAERQSYYNATYDTVALRNEVERLQWAEAVVLVFPTWWFGFPAILKGWFDRVWAPGVAYDHARDFGPITPRLKQLRHLVAITTLGSPWWVDRLVLWQPVKRVLKTAIVGTSAPRCRVRMVSLYRSERLSPEQVARWSARVSRALAELR